MSRIQVDDTYNKEGTGAPTFPVGANVTGVVTATSFSNVDSVGIITAQAGIKIGAGQSISAVSGIITYYGDGSQLSGISVESWNQLDTWLYSP